jgi:RNA-binding protein
VSTAVLAAADQALLDHELIKIKVRIGDRDARDAAITAVCAGVGAQCAGRVGNVAIVYRAHPDQPRIALPA